jgi:hypothetical protein
MAMARGMHKVEFFTHIDEIRSMYEDGYVVLKILYKELKKKYNWSMSYWSFCKYMKEEIISKEMIQFAPKNETISQIGSQMQPSVKKVEESMLDQNNDADFEKVDESDKEEKQRLAQEILDRNAAFIPEKWK